MRAQVFQFLSDIAANNNREWFHAHQDAYRQAADTFEAMAAMLIERIGEFDPAIRGIEAKQTLYRFARDTRFSPDKSPYKRHFGTYINSHGRKSLHGGYYFHMEPGNCMVALGDYYLPTNVSNAVRRSIMADTARYLDIIGAPGFVRFFKTIGLDRVKTLPKGFSRDYAHPELIRPKDFCIWTPLPDEAILRSDWLDTVIEPMKAGQAHLAFVNETVDDYI